MFLNRSSQKHEEKTGFDNKFDNAVTDNGDG